MLIKITEYCAWENERWSYVFDMGKQNSSAINHLMIFQRLANEVYEEIKENVPTPKRLSIFDRPIKIFAASFYRIDYWDSVETDSKGHVTLINDSSKLNLDSNGSYKSGGIYLDTIISSRKMLSAKLKMRDKKENILYKNFEYVFLSAKNKKVKSLNKQHSK